VYLHWVLFYRSAMCAAKLEIYLYFKMYPGENILLKNM
jgi:hypothetical protein